MAQTPFGDGFVDFIESEKRTERRRRIWKVVLGVFALIVIVTAKRVFFPDVELWWLATGFWNPLPLWVRIPAVVLVGLAAMNAAHGVMLGEMRKFVATFNLVAVAVIFTGVAAMATGWRFDPGPPVSVVDTDAPSNPPAKPSTSSVRPSAPQAKPSVASGRPWHEDMGNFVHASQVINRYDTGVVLDRPQRLRIQGFSIHNVGMPVCSGLAAGCDVPQFEGRRIHSDLKHMAVIFETGNKWYAMNGTTIDLPVTGERLYLEVNLTDGKYEIDGGMWVLIFPKP